jgi:protein-S-isoprenylcysteine O-methyltransferase Ste14
MPSETPFRVALAVSMLLTIMIAAYHRLRAASSGEKISRKEEGCLFAIVLRLAGLCVWIATFAYLIFPSSVEWAAVPLPTWVRWIGVATGALCPLLMYWTLSSLGKNLTDTIVTRAQATLVTHGPYRWVRHPFYVTAALVMGSVTLLTANWLIGLSSLIVLALLAVRTPKEEQMLIERFGQQYRDYMAKTGRFFPRRNVRRLHGL